MEQPRLHLTGTAEAQIQSHTFNIGSIQWLNASGNDSIEKNIAGEKMYQWTGNVGLVNVSDVLRASTNIACTSATDQMNKVTQDIPKITCDSNYLLDTLPDPTGYWTINAFSAESVERSHRAWYVAHISGVVGLVNFDAYGNSSIGARPVVFLNSSIQITGGDGTKENSYLLSI